MRFLGITAFALAVAAVAPAQILAQTTAAVPASNWEYEGPRGALEWHRLDPAYKTCGAGHEQSPIDIRGAHLNKALAPLEFHFIAGPVRLENNGHTVLAHVDRGSYLVADGVRYELTGFDFHHPSEESVKGKLTGMDVQFHYQSADGKQATVAVFLKEDMDHPNAVLASLWPSLPKTAGATAKVADEINAAGLLPADLGYWTYAGSLSTPPCTEGVRWFVLENEVTIGRDQLRAFAYLFKVNTRPLQDVHGRRIEANE
jgi:carbonic anhydrase